MRLKKEKQNKYLYVAPPPERFIFERRFNLLIIVSLSLAPVSEVAGVGVSRVSVSRTMFRARVGVGALVFSQTLAQTRSKYHGYMAGNSVK